MYPNLRLAAWWLILVLLVVACIYTTVYTFLFSFSEARLIDGFRNVIDYETGQWRGDNPNMRPIDYHKNWGVKHDVVGLGIRLITLSSSALAAFLLGTLWWRGRRSSKSPSASYGECDSTHTLNMHEKPTVEGVRTTARRAAVWWWPTLILLVLASVLTTSAALRWHNGKGKLLDDFRQAIDWETGKWQFVEGEPHLRAPIYFHKEWSARHGITALVIRLMTLCWFALSLFLAISLCWREWSNRRRRSGPENAQHPEKILGMRSEAPDARRAHRIRTFLWGIGLSILVMACISSTTLTLWLDGDEAHMKEEFIATIAGVQHPAATGLFHKHWLMQHELTGVGMAAMAISWAALGAVMATTLWWMSRRAASASPFFTPETSKSEAEW